MDWYYYIAWLAIAVQLCFLALMMRNYRYALSRYDRPRTWYRPKAALIVPCKGEDVAFEENITSFFKLDYEPYQLFFVVEDESDPAYPRLCELKEKLSADSKAQEVHILVAGRAKECSQKIHNLLYCYERVGGDVEVLAFADSDACIGSAWLSHIVYPLRQTKYGVASGYRWFVPKRNNVATLALSALNAKVAQLLGNSRFNHVWGGSMAIRTEVFRELEIDKIWPKALSDDLTVSEAVKRSGRKVAFIPACLVASYETTTWAGLFEFGRRQFLITRVNAPRTWRFGLWSGFYSILGLWGGTGLALYADSIDDKNIGLYVGVPVLFFISQMFRAILRQLTARQLLEKDRKQMRVAMAADILFFWLWTLLLFGLICSSAFGRTIRWRGIRYKLLGPTETIVVDDESDLG